MSAEVAADYRVAVCPTTGETCPAKRLIVDNYAPMPADVQQRLDSILDPDDPTHPRYDTVKLHLKLGEHAAWATRTGCEGPKDGVCHVRERMNESTVRTGFLKAVRGLLSKVRKV